MIDKTSFNSTNSILRSISMAVIGILIVFIISCWLGQSLVAAGYNKEELKLLAAAVFIPGMCLGLIGLLTIGYICFPNYNDKIENYATQSLGKVLLCLVTGVINTVLVLILFNIPIIRMVALIFFVIFGTIGLGNLTKIIGDKVYSISGEDTTPFKSLVTGIIFLIMIQLLPFLGQAIFVIVTCIGLGSAIIALFVKKTNEPASIHQETP